MDDTILATERLSIRVAPEVKARVDARAAESGQRPTDWVREVIDGALDVRVPDESQPPSEQAGLEALAVWIDTRIRATETRMAYHVDAILQYLSEVLQDAIHAEAFARAAASGYPNEDPEVQKAIIDQVGREGAATFKSRLDHGVERTKAMRNKGDEKAKNLTKSLVQVAADIESQKP